MSKREIIIWAIILLYFQYMFLLHAARSGEIHVQFTISLLFFVFGIVLYTIWSKK